MALPCSVVFGFQNGLSAEHRERWVYVGQNDPTTRQANHASKFSHDGVEVIGTRAQRQRTHDEVHAFVRKWGALRVSESRCRRIGSFFLATANISYWCQLLNHLASLLKEKLGDGHKLTTARIQ